VPAGGVISSLIMLTKISGVKKLVVGFGREQYKKAHVKRLNNLGVS